MNTAGIDVHFIQQEAESAMTKAREPVPTVAFIDDYCAHYHAVFPNVRQFEQFTHLELGLVAETKRKSLPRLAQTTKADPQAFHHFLAKADWSVEALRAVRLELTRQALRERPFILCIDETGDRKKGKTTDYAASQYIGNVHTLANGVVSVNAYGVLDTVTFPLAFPSALPRLGLQYVGAIRPNHIVWTFPGERVRQTRWRPFARVFTDGTSEQRYICEFVFGKRGRPRYFVVTTDPVHLPPETTWHLMTNLPGKIERSVGNTFGLRTWIEYGFKHAKDELRWADYRLTDAHSIARWWELVMCAYLLVSLQAPALAVAPADEPAAMPASRTPAHARQHAAWTEDASWKHRLTNLRLFLQPFVCSSLLLPWLRIHPLPHLSAGLADLCALMNTYHPLVPL